MTTLPRSVTTRRRAPASSGGRRCRRHRHGRARGRRVLAGAAIGAVGGAGVAPTDHQEEKLARIPGTTVERLTTCSWCGSIPRLCSTSICGFTLRRHDAHEVAGVLNEYKKVGDPGYTDLRIQAYNQQLREAGPSRRTTISQGIDSRASIGFGEVHPSPERHGGGRQLNRRVLLARATDPRNRGGGLRARGSGPAGHGNTTHPSPPASWACMVWNEPDQSAGTTSRTARSPTFEVEVSGG
jgi:hypothetical protein